jgi:hypothetical protein
MRLATDLNRIGLSQLSKVSCENGSSILSMFALWTTKIGFQARIGASEGPSYNFDAFASPRTGFGSRVANR